VLCASTAPSATRTGNSCFCSCLEEALVQQQGWGSLKSHLYFRKGCSDFRCHLKLGLFQPRHRDGKDRMAASFWIHISPLPFLSLFSPISTHFTTPWSAVHSPSLHNCCSKSVIVLPAMNSACCNSQETINKLQDCSIWGGRGQMRTWLSTECCAYGL